MKKFIWGSLIVLVCLVAAGVLGKDFLIKQGIISGAKHTTGLEVAMNKFWLGLIASDMGMNGLTIMNPAHYPDREMVNCPEIYGRISLAKLFQRKIHVREARFHMKEFTVVKNKDGKVNITEMKGLLVKGKGKEKPASKEPGESWPLYVEKLDLEIGDVVYKDYSRGGEPLTQRFRVGLKETYYNIDNPKAFMNLVVSRALFNTSINKLADLNLDDMNQLSRATIEDSKKFAKEQMQRGVEVAREGATRMKEGSREAISQTRERTKSATIEMKKTTQEATKDIKSLFGGEQQ